MLLDRLRDSRCAPIEIRKNVPGYAETDIVAAVGRPHRVSVIVERPARQHVATAS